MRMCCPDTRMKVKTLKFTFCEDIKRRIFLLNVFALFVFVFFAMIHLKDQRLISSAADEGHGVRFKTFRTKLVREL